MGEGGSCDGVNLSLPLQYRVVSFSRTESPLIGRDAFVGRSDKIEFQSAIITCSY